MKNRYSFRHVASKASCSDSEILGQMRGPASSSSSAKVAFSTATRLRVFTALFDRIGERFKIHAQWVDRLECAPLKKLQDQAWLIT